MESNFWQSPSNWRDQNINVRAMKTAKTSQSKIPEEEKNSYIELSSTFCSTFPFRLSLIQKRHGCKKLRSWEPEQSFWQLHESGESKISVNCPVSRKSLGEYLRLPVDAVGGLRLHWEQTRLDKVVCLYSHCLPENMVFVEEGNTSEPNIHYVQHTVKNYQTFQEIAKSLPN